MFTRLASLTRSEPSYSRYGAGPGVGSAVASSDGDGLTALPGMARLMTALSKVAFAITGTKWSGPPLLWTER